MHYDAIIVGAGIVGLATAKNLLDLKPDYKIAIIEKESSVAVHQTGHNSGVIHSGIYYKPNSLKAKNCIEGYKLLINFCNENGVEYELCGKIIAAADESEREGLHQLYLRGQENGLEGLRKLTAAEVKEIEPHINAVEGLWVPQTGIVNYKQVSQTIANLIEEKGAELFFDSRVKDIKVSDKQAEVITQNATYTANLVINCAGLYSDKVAKLTQKDIDVKIVPFRGEYYKLKPEKEYLINNLVYPVPNPEFPFLGVHFTRMIKGGVEAGPNAVLAFAREGYKKSDINLSELLETLTYPGFLKIAGKYWKDGLGEMHRSWSKSAFTKALQRLLPEVQEDDLMTGGSGVRAQACDSKGNLLDDFVFFEQERIINVCNAPSPAATASLAIGKTIAEKVFN